MDELQGFVLFRKEYPKAAWLLSYPYDVCRWGPLERVFLMREMALFEKPPEKSPLDPNPDDVRYPPRLKTFVTQKRAAAFIADPSRGSLCTEAIEICQIVLDEHGIRFVPVPRVI